MSGMLSLMYVQSLFQFGAKVGNERAITGIKIILTCSLKQLLRKLFTLEFFDFLPWLGTSSKKTTPPSFRSEASTYDLTCSGDRDDHRTCHITVYCFSLKMGRTCGNTQEFFVCSMSRLSRVVNRNERKDDGQHWQGSYKKCINRDCIKSKRKNHRSWWIEQRLS